MKSHAYYLLVMLLITGCTKDQPSPELPVREDQEEETIPELPDREDSTDVYTNKTWQNTRSSYYVDSEVTEDLFLGLIWHLKDTADNVQLEALKYDYEPFDIWYWGDGVTPLQQVKPSYQEMRDYMYKHANESEAGGFNFESSTFSDYAEIKRWLPDNIDRRKFLKLAEQQDSTIARKPFTSLIRSETIQFTIRTDFSDFQTNFSEKYLKDVLTKKRSPYFFDAASYGKHLIIMAESDSTRSSINIALEALLKDQALDEIGENVIAASSVCVYLRGGRKESLIGKAEGSADIKGLLKTVNKEWKNENGRFDFPLFYYAMSLENFQALKYDFSFNYLVKEK